MDEDVKICPECSAEYLAHVEVCRSCDARLVRPGHEQGEAIGSVGADGVEAEGAELVCVDEGAMDRLVELSAALSRAGIESTILAPDQRGGRSCSGAALGLFVAELLAVKAHELIRAHMHRLYPEAMEAERRLQSGLCPACGAPYDGGAACVDCGLALGDDLADDGCGNEGSGNCGSC